jgi:aldose 1-epimerase
MNTSATIRSGRWVAAIDGAAGGRLARLQWQRSNGDWVDVVVPMTAPLQGSRWPKAGAYPLVPYSNRIANAVLAFQGTRYALAPHPDAVPHTLHGHGHLRPWECEATASTADLRMTSGACADWPWVFRATQRFTVDTDALVLDMSIQNLDAGPMPAGLGWHPFFACNGPATLRHGAATWWPHDDQFIPTGEAAPAGPGWRSPVRFDSEARNGYLSANQGAFEIEHASGVRVRVTGDSALDHLVVHYPAGGQYLCVEPTTHVANGFNLADKGCPGTGLRIIEPGGTLNCSVRVEISD